MTAGYRLYKALAPGPWFNSVGIDEYYSRYRAEILGPLDPRKVRDDLDGLAAGRTPVLLCYERPGGADWCHRAMAAEWLAEALASLSRVRIRDPATGRTPAHAPSASPRDRPFRRSRRHTYIGRTAIIEGELHTVAGADPQRPGMAIIVTGGRSFSTTIDTIRRHFNQA